MLGGRYKTAMILAAAVLGPVLFWVVLDAAIVTDEERIERIFEEMARAVGRGDVEAALAPVADDYRHMGLTRADLRAVAEAYLDRFGRTRVRVADARVAVSGRRAAASVRAPWWGEGAGAGGFRVPTWWEFTLEKRGREWVVVEITPVRFGRFEAHGWRPILRRLDVVPGAGRRSRRGPAAGGGSGPGAP